MAGLRHKVRHKNFSWVGKASVRGVAFSKLGPIDRPGKIRIQNLSEESRGSGAICLVSRLLGLCLQIVVM